MRRLGKLDMDFHQMDFERLLHQALVFLRVDRKHEGSVSAG